MKEQRERVIVYIEDRRGKEDDLSQEVVHLKCISDGKQKQYIYIKEKKMVSTAAWASDLNVSISWYLQGQLQYLETKFGSAAVAFGFKYSPLCISCNERFIGP